MSPNWASAPAPAHAVAVRAVVPCYNRPDDLRLLLGDLARLGPGLDLRVLVVDNASSEPITIPDQPGIELLRLEENIGGSGGFNAGLAHWLAQGRAGDPDELFWLIDSDARPDTGTLNELIAALAARPDAAVAGSAIADPRTRRVFEVGGRINPRTGELACADFTGGRSPVEVEYVAACSLLVRRRAVEAAGLMSDIFLNGDDVEWCIRIRQRTGRAVIAVPASVIYHPKPDRMRTWARYYTSRNATVFLDRARAGGGARLMRSLRETARAFSMAMIGRDDLAELHLRGLGDAAGGRQQGAATPSLTVDPLIPLGELPEALKRAGAGPEVVVQDTLDLADHASAAIEEDLRRAGFQVHRRPGRVSPLFALLRFVLPRPGAAVVSGRGWPAAWLAGRVTASVLPEGAHIASTPRLGRAVKGLGIALRGGALALRLALRSPTRPDLVPAAPAGRASRPTNRLSVVVLSYNRSDALSRTLVALAGMLDEHDEVIVVDNASSDGSSLRAAVEHPSVRVLALPANLGVDGFNIGASHARGEFLLILDDDAAPEPEHLAAAIELLGQRPDLAAVALHPRRPGTQRSEWPFAENASPTDRWPIMGCGNLVRKDAWEQAGGYEPSFFLYRNDADLALKLLDLGLGVHFNPAWTVWHDSPAATNKSLRWYRLATRNWVWLSRRHARNVHGVLGILAGWAWAHRTAGISLRAHTHILAGVVSGLVRRGPRWEHAGKGSAFRELLKMRFSARKGTPVQGRAQGRAS